MLRKCSKSFFAAFPIQTSRISDGLNSMTHPEEIHWITPYPTREDCKRRFQFTLRSLFIVTAILAAFSAASARWGVAGAYLVLLAGAVLQIGRGIWQRRAGLAVFGVIGAIMLLGFSIPLFSVAIWDGRATVSLQFIVVDSTTDKPVPNATVRIRRTIDFVISTSRQTIPTGEHGVQANTSNDGTVVLAEEFNTTGHEGVLENYGFVLFRYYGEEYWVQVSASGYETCLVPLISLTGVRRDIEDRTPPPMRILLDPVAANR
jgi:hypothetical protein